MEPIEIFINSVQVGATLTFVAYCFLLLYVWREGFLTAWRKVWTRGSPPLGEGENLALGIVIGFAGNMMDNLYWGITWMLLMWGLDAGQEWLNNGPFANIFFRQLPGILAVYFHVKAAHMIHAAEFNLKNHTVAYVILGLFTTLVMLRTTH